MVHGSKPQRRADVQSILGLALIALLSSSFGHSGNAHAGLSEGRESLRSASRLYDNGKYYSAARYAFAALDEHPSLKAASYAGLTRSLMRAGLPHAASYFFIRTLQSKSRPSIRQVTPFAGEMIYHVSGDLIRRYMIRHTKLSDYDASSRSAYLYVLAKDALLKGKYRSAAKRVDEMATGSSLYPFGLQIKGTALAITNRSQGALNTFRDCVSRASGALSNLSRFSTHRSEVWRARQERQARDLKNRCQASLARTLYQMNKFKQADIEYDRVEKKSFVWTDILFEQAWNAYAQGEFNRTLGKLVTYKSPGLGFVFNPEVDVLRSQTYLALCLYSDSNKIVKDFNRSYSGVAKKVKRFVDGNRSNLRAFYRRGRRALADKLHTKDGVHRFMNRFVRSPYFVGLVEAEEEIESEMRAANQFTRLNAELDRSTRRGFVAFLKKVLGWRKRTAQLLGGAFVKNSMIDYHRALLADFDKMSFVKLELLKYAKEQLLYNRDPRLGARNRGSKRPERRDDQYYWSFNGEFWSDEMGDYVFGLESACRKSKRST